MWLPNTWNQCITVRQTLDSLFRVSKRPGNSRSPENFLNFFTAVWYHFWGAFYWICREILRGNFFFSKIVSLQIFYTRVFLIYQLASWSNNNCINILLSVQYFFCLVFSLAVNRLSVASIIFKVSLQNFASNLRKLINFYSPRYQQKTYSLV